MRPSEADSLAEALVRRGATMCCAESCTGGLIGAAMTEVPGSSSYFLGSAVTYSNGSKERVLGVGGGTLAAHGAVSEETAREMALGAAHLYCADFSEADTGIAGPGGATETKPVGLVWIAVSDGSRTVAQRSLFEGDRSEVRAATVREACSMLRDFVEGML